MPAEEQSKYLENLGVSPSADELALEFDDMFVPLSAHWRDTGDSQELLAACTILDAALKAQTDWTVADLRADSWTQIRILSQRARDAVGVATG